jgi:hypothetical protein
MAEERGKIGTIQMCDNDSRIKKNTLPFLTEEKIVDLILCAGRNGNKRPHGGKYLPTKTDITMWHHWYEVWGSCGKELVEFNQITGSADCAIWRAVANGTPDDCIVIFLMSS